MAAASTCKFHPTNYKYLQPSKRIIPYISCIAQPSQSNIKVIINGAAKEIGRAAVVAVTNARGMEIVGAVDSHLVGQDIGKLKANAVVVDFTDASAVYDNVKQGCLVAPTLSIGSILLQQAAISASFHYNNVEIVESRATAGDLPSQEAIQIANNMTNLGQMYNREDASTDILARGQVVGDDGVRVHSLVLPGIPSSTTVHFSRPGEVYTVKHDITNVHSLMPGLLLAIRKVVRLKVILTSSQFRNASNDKYIYEFATYVYAESGLWFGEVPVASPTPSTLAGDITVDRSE
ncbi:hypothetical protein SASPL_157071 [Salvia splendens]|uniref:Dihydrodipicolinate reductase C-terminal domain-containing protein n=1 Tax=Salvia splendens TaxID=180675 RepID=A0A8X8VVI6_SALSN|nr:hypothetical protein SASPL_157071 [Salvia splendens]